MTREEAIEVIKAKADYLESDKRFRAAVETIIPELRESEDERIRKDIINLIYWLKGNPSLCSQYYKDRYDGMLSWLEKKKGRKPADLSEMMVHKEPYIAPVPTPMVADGQKPVEDEDTINLMIAILRANHPNGQFITDPVNTTCVSTDVLIKRIESLRPKLSSQPNINHTMWHNASEEKPTKLPIIHVWYHGNRVNAVVAHENIGLQAELDDINFQPDDKWAYVEDLLNAQPSWKPSEDDIKMLEHIIGQYEIGNKNCKTMGYLPRVEELNFLKKILDVWKN